MRPNATRDGFLPSPLSLPAVAVVAMALPALGGAQERSVVREKEPPPPSIFDFRYEVEDPRDLFPPERPFEDRWRRIWGTAGMRYHLYPSQQTGPDNWPPHMFEGGMNYSIWRNPVTGWPEF